MDECAQYGVPIKEFMIKEAALLISKELNLPNFRASNGWFRNLKAKNLLKLHKKITKDIFTNYLSKLNSKFVSENRKVIVFLDNFSGHKIEDCFFMNNVCFDVHCVVHLFRWQSFA